VADKDEEAGPVGARTASNVGTIHTLPHDEESIGQLLAPALQRIDVVSPALQALIITPDAESALAFSRATYAGEDIPPVILAATSAPRALRILKATPARAVAGTPQTLVALMEQSALKLEGVRTVIVAWADEILTAGEGDALGTVMAEVPKDASRVLVAEELTEAVEEIAERYLRRAHRLVPVAAVQPGAPLALSYVATTHAARPMSLRRVLDDLNPPSAAIFARTEGSVAEARKAVRYLGYGRDDENITVTTGSADPSAALIILYDVPASAEQLRIVVGEGPRRVVALARPRDIRRLRALAGTMPTPLAPQEPGQRARKREEMVRDVLRAELRKGIPDHQLLALEPLLEEYDGIEIAAAALRLLESEREARTATPVAATAASAPGAFVRLFMTVGQRDNVRPGDLVGMITGQGGITSDQIGKIEVRENHSLVEIASTVAEGVAAKITGAVVKGRKLIARPERPREERPPGRDDRSRGPDRGPREDRPRGGDRSARDVRPRSDPRGDRGLRNRGSADSASRRPGAAGTEDRSAYRPGRNSE
jgi:ATP-dependent RNA helicase DeaD